MSLKCIQFSIISTCFLAVVSLLQGTEVELQFKEATWFPDEIATALIFLDVEEEPVLELPETSDDVRIYSNEVRQLKDDVRGTFVVILEFVPRRGGVRTFPSVRLSSGGFVFDTRPKQFLVSETLTTDRMSLAVTPAKTEAYVGEPLRIDFGWSSDLPIDQMRAFRLVPAFFNEPDVKVFVPRSQIVAEEELGLPVGGRRVIAHRIRKSASPANELGEVHFSVWVRFEAAGRFEFPETELLCSMLEDKGYGSHQYASYFNNSLFEPIDRTKEYRKLRTRSDAFAIEVLPLVGAGQMESFSGLFSPASIDVSVSPLQLELGQLMEIRVDVKSEASSEMLRLAPLSLQRSLRHRFWVSEEMNEAWRPDGRSFVARARPLSVESGFFPSLSFQVFDTAKGRYRTIETDSIPLQIERKNGLSYFSIENLPGSKRVVKSNSQGVWHNDKGSIMKDLAHALISFFSEGVGVFLLLGPLLYFVLRPWARELRRRVVDEAYGARRAAFARFCGSLEGAGSAREALRSLVADCFGRSASTLTAQDAGDLLRGQGPALDFAGEVEALLRVPEAELYSASGNKDRSQAGLDVALIRSLGKKVYRSLNKTMTLLVFFALVSLGSESEAASWEGAEESFAAALDFADSGAVSSRIEEAFAEAALAFEACAQEGIRPGSAWYNSGNAWFKAGEIGRSIAAFRKAESFMPFNGNLKESLAAARALRVDALSAGELASPAWPSRWSYALLSLLWLLGWGGLLFWQRYRGRVLLALAVGCFAGSLLAGTVELRDLIFGSREGVLIAAEAYGRKGPGYAYQSAFQEPLHSGLELRLLEDRDAWVRVGFGSDRDCWLPRETVEEL